MSVILLFLALACLIAIGGGVALLRATRRSAITTSGAWPAARAWAATLQGRRAVAVGITLAGTILFLLILALRP